MDTLHTMLRALRGETKSRPDHLAVFREFIDHLGRLDRRDRRIAVAAAKPLKARPRRRGK